MSKYDCEKIKDFTHERQRMCKYYVICDNCPFVDISEGKCHKEQIESITQKHIDALQKWSDEHPEENEYISKQQLLNAFKHDIMGGLNYRSIIDGLPTIIISKSTEGKYDCEETKDFAHEYKRMCDSFTKLNEIFDRCTEELRCSVRDLEAEVRQWRIIDD